MTDGKCPRGAGQPRILRFRDAPRYLGMDRNRFNAEVRPYLTEIPIGKQGVGFDRLELDAWVDDYKSRNGRPASERRQVMGRKRVPGLIMRAGIWHIDKRILGRRICQSTGTDQLEEAETAPRESDGRDPASAGLWCQALSNLRAGRGQVCAGEPAQAQPRRRRRAAEGAYALDRRRASGPAAHGHAAALDAERRQRGS